MKTKKLKAIGLVEALVVLAIVGVTMVSAMQLTTGAFRSIRDNEIIDLANGFLIQGLEIAKSPQRVVLTNEFGSVLEAPGSYSIDLSVDPPVLFQVSSQSNTLIRSCVEEYKVEVTQSVAGDVSPDICLQIVIIEQPDLSYKIQSHVVYSTREGQLERTLTGFRAEQFVF